MEPLTTVRTQFWVKVLLALGVPLLGWAGVYTMWLAVESKFDPLVANIVYFGSGLFCGLAVLKALPLFRFVLHKLTLYEGGIEITKGPISKFLVWDQVGSIVGSDTFNILRIYDRSGRLVYAVDYSAKNFKQFAGLLNELVDNRP